MAASKGQRVGAFLLALLFLLTTVGTAGYVVYELNREEAGLVEVTPTETPADTPQDTSTEPTEEQPVQTLANFTGPITIPELRFDDEVVGDGAAVAPGATVTIHYTGALASDGTVFDSSRSRGDEPATFPLDNLIQGWQEGIPGMKVGGKRRLYIPASLGYGASATGGIPANSDLIFDIELIATE